MIDSLLSTAAASSSFSFPRKRRFGLASGLLALALGMAGASAPAQAQTTPSCGIARHSTQGASIVENDVTRVVGFEVTCTAALPAMTSVRYVLSQGGDYVDNTGIRNISNTNSVATFSATATLIDDDTPEDDGWVTATMLGPASGSAYTVGTPTMASVTVTSEDGNPYIGVQLRNASGEVSSGGSFDEAADSEVIVQVAGFSDMAGTTAVTLSSFNVAVELTTVNNLLPAAPEGATTVTVAFAPARGAATAMTAFALSDGIHNGGGSVAARVLSGSRYMLGANASTATVAITANPNQSDPAVTQLNILDTNGAAVASDFTEGSADGLRASVTLAWSGGATNRLDRDIILSVEPTVDALVGFPAGSTTRVTLTVPSGSNSGHRDFPVTDDNIKNPDGSVLFRAVSSVDYIVVAGDARVNLIDDDPLLPTVTLSADAALPVVGGIPTVTEGADVVMQLSLSRAHTAALTVPITIDEVGNFVDFQGRQTRQVVVPQGETEWRFTVDIIDDNTDEPDESLTIAIDTANVPASHAGVAGSIVVSLLDDEADPVLQVADAGGAEGGEARFAVRLVPASGAVNGNVSDKEVTVDYAATAEMSRMDTAVAGTDFTAVMGTLTFAPGAALQEAVVPLGEDDDEDDATFTVTFSSPVNATFTGGSTAAVAVRGTVQELPGLAIAADDADGSVTEGEMATFTVSLSRALSEAVTVPVTVEQTGNVLGTAPASVEIPAGALSAQLNVPLDNDGRDEADGSITVTISLPSDAFTFFGAMSAMLAVTDDDEPPSVYVVAAESVSEGQPLRFPVRLTGASGRMISVDYSTEAGGGTAAAGQDYDAAAGTLRFAPGQTEHIVEVATKLDDASDPDETVALTLSQPVNAMLGEARATGLIREGLSDGEVEALNEAILPHIAAAIAGETADSLRDRVRAAYEGGSADAAFSIRGSAPGEFLTGLVPSELRHFGEAARLGEAARHSRASGNLEQWAGVLDSRLRGNDGGGFNWALPALSAADFNFAAALNGGSGGAYQGIGLWGRGYHRALSLEDAGPIGFRGDIEGAMLGLDARFYNGLVGLALNHAESDLDWENPGFTGGHRARLSSAHPYFAWRWDGGLLLWGSVGYGEGEAELDEASSPAFLYERDLEFRAAALGLYGPVLRRGGLAIGIIADAAYAELEESEDGHGTVTATAVETGWFRAGVDADYSRALGGGALGAGAELAMRGDAGDAKSGLGLEVGSHVDYRHPSGLRIDVRGRALLAHKDNSVQEMGLSGGVSWNSGADGRGFSLAFAPEWGAIGSARDLLWNGGFALHRSPLEGGRAIGGGRGNAALRYNLELNYGLPVLQGREVVILYARRDLRGQTGDYALGAKFNYRF